MTETLIDKTEGQRVTYVAEAAEARKKRAKLRRTMALHAAGIAVITTVEGKKIFEAKVHRDAVVDMDHEETTGKMEARIAIAGYEAEKLFDENFNEKAAYFRIFQDFIEFDRVFGRKGPWVRDEIVEALTKRSRQVKEFASAILQKQTLDERWLKKWQSKTK